MKVYCGFDPGKDGALAILGYRETPILIPFSETEYANQLRRLDPLGSGLGTFGSETDARPSSVFCVMFWPLTAVLIACVIAGDALHSGCRFVAERFPRFTRWTKLVLAALTLPFRPWRIGRMLRRRR